MLEQIEDWFLSEPGRLVDLGWLLARLGGGVILVGLIANIGTTVTSLPALGGHAGQVKTLADVYPDWPTWWVPESIIGALPALLLAVFGVWLNITGRRIQRIMGRT